MTGPKLVIAIGSAVFVFVLALSAAFEADIRWLHFFQAWMYVVTVALAWRENRWGYFVGVSAAGFWAYGAAFVTNFLQSGLRWLWVSVTTGHLQHPDQIVAVAGWAGNVAVIAGCVWGYSRLDKSWRDGARFVLAFALTTAFFAAAMAVCQPRYLPMFRRSLHPHSPFVLPAP